MPCFIFFVSKGKIGSGHFYWWDVYLHFMIYRWLKFNLPKTSTLDCTQVFITLFQSVIIRSDRQNYSYTNTTANAVVSTFQAADKSHNVRHMIELLVVASGRLLLLRLGTSIPGSLAPSHRVIKKACLENSTSMHNITFCFRSIIVLLLFSIQEPCWEYT